MKKHYKIILNMEHPEEYSRIFDAKSAARSLLSENKKECCGWEIRDSRGWQVTNSERWDTRWKRKS